MNGLFTQWMWTYLLDFGPWRWSALNTEFVEKWPSWMHMQWFLKDGHDIVYHCPCLIFIICMTRFSQACYVFNITKVNSLYPKFHLAAHGAQKRYRVTYPRHFTSLPTHLVLDILKRLKLLTPRPIIWLVWVFSKPTLNQHLKDCDDHSPLNSWCLTTQLPMWHHSTRDVLSLNS